MKASPIEIIRARLEAKIEELVALLDLVDGDENLEPYLADTYPEKEDREDDDEREPDGDELDYNGDEQDCSFIEDEGFGQHGYDGSGVDYAERLIKSVPKAAKRARSFSEESPIPIVYDFRGMHS
ncbi:hypothetical protein SRABI05_00100 [Agrobacterium fabrum]|uniref:hypothetical protein n=1 Tax=Agrobacterium fabrum TaxID=1176649 RepID=UPI001D862160|nr:hypothetical protein [Agrobacterium fabrum]CAH0133247.1 hypothetical protein SRABI05_00100 [Agrobacterium fabrum]CAH0152729.1 hypothetical protein SRABI46_00815 [Agrobacterium fabrum]